MATIVTRSGKGSPLTHAEVDSNFTNLNTDKLETAGGSMTGNLSFGDNDKAIFGAGSDLQIYHDGANSYIKDAGTGDLKIQGANVRLENPSGVRYFQGSSGVSYLYNSGDIKLNTTSTGIDVTGTVTADGLTVDLGNTTDVTVNGTDGGGIQFNYGGVNQVRIDSASNDGGVYHAPTGKNHTFKTDGANRLKIATGGDISFYEDTGTTAKFFWDASAESLGIGTTTNSRKLNIQGDQGIRLFNDATDSYLDIDHGTDGAIIKQSVTTKDILFRSGTASGELVFETGGAERMVIDSSGNVGIGTSSPTRQLTVSNSGAALLLLESTGDDNGQLLFGDSASGTVGKVGYAHSTNHMFFHTNGSERMRIDSSGNLLVGKTSSSSTVQGIAIKPNGQGVFTSDGGTGALFNRLTSDGDIVQFRKDGTTVGSIGTSGGDLYVGNGTRSLMWTGTSVFPRSGTGGISDATVDLGNGSNRFKDFYLSGAANVGGQVVSSSSFKLDTNVSTPTGNTIFRPASNTLAFGTNSSERMRIDSSGNLLVGTTDTTPFNNSAGTSADFGFVVNKGGGYTSLASYNTTPLYINRTSSDGDIVNFRKNGTTVGSIGNSGTALLFENPNANSYLAFHANNQSNGIFYQDGTTKNFAPYTARTGEFDLGNSGGRWKDLYLSGGVYLGGTGAANKLDDYEEGTWTPTTSGDATGTLTVAQGFYRKIGNMVFAFYQFDVGVTFTSNTIGGLPFTVGNIFTASSIIGATGAVYTTGTATSCANESSTILSLFEPTGGTNSAHEPLASGGVYRGNVVYMTS